MWHEPSDRRGRIAATAPFNGGNGRRAAFIAVPRTKSRSLAGARGGSISPEVNVEQEA